MDTRIFRRALSLVPPALFLILSLIACKESTTGGADVPADCVSAQSWDTAETIETEDAGGAGNPKITMDANGNAIAVWSQSDGTRRNIWANRYDGQSWGTAELIEADPGDADHPQIAMDADGNAIAVWVQDHDTPMPMPPPGFPVPTEVRPAILTNRFDGSDWGEVELLWVDYFATAGDPQITMNAAGHAKTVWKAADYSYSFTNTRVYANHFDGSDWSAPKQIQSNDYGFVYCTRIAMDAAGAAIAVWNQDYGTKVRPAILAKRFNGSAWGRIRSLYTSYFGSSSAPQITMHEGGSAMAVWVGNKDNSYQALHVMAIHHDGGSWGDVKEIQTDDSGSADTPQVAMNVNGKAIAVWSQSVGTRSTIWANLYDGLSWGTAVRIDTENSGGAENPQIAMDANGNAVAVWSQSDGAVNSIWANRFDGQSWATAELIETDNAGDAANPQNAMDANCNAVAVWSQSDGTRGNICVNHLE